MVRWSTPPVTSLVSVTGDASSPYYVTTSGDNNVQILVAGETGTCWESPISIAKTKLALSAP